VLAVVLLLASAGVAPPAPAGAAAYFATLPPGAALPGDASCAARVRRGAWEPRPDNTAANRAVPRGLALARWTGVDERANTRILARVSGNFTGTTDEIIQWGACKWGVDEDLVRAMAVRESNWRQDQRGDIHGGTPQSFGLLQVKRTTWGGTHPHSERSTAFNVDYALAAHRACYEGYTTWLREFTGGYRAGDEWGCVGLWYAGRWRTPAAEDYIAKIRRHRAERAWRTWPDAAALVALVDRRIIRGYADGRLGADDTTQRAQMAAMIARALRWDGEDRGNPFVDRGGTDAALWRNVGTLAHRGVARGYGDGTFRPARQVTRAETIAFITRALVAGGRWAPGPDPGAGAPGGPHRRDLATYLRRVGALPAGSGDLNQPATRAWFAAALWPALRSAGLVR
jgi:autotransporter family porin